MTADTEDGRNKQRGRSRQQPDSADHGDNDEPSGRRRRRATRQRTRVGGPIEPIAASEQWALELLDRNPAAILVLDAQQRVVYANRSAAELCSACDGIRLSAERVTLLRDEDDERLQRLIAKTASATTSPPVSHSGAMRTVRPSGKRPYVFVVAAVGKRYRALSTFRPAVWIVINDPDGQTPVPSERLQAAFGLTEAEARLAALLGAGDELRASAEKLGITYGTARARLAGVFEKTQTRRQSELVKLLLWTVALG